MNRTRRLGAGLEKLERRELFAGNVTVSVTLFDPTDVGTLRIVGDNSPNTVAVWSGANPYQVVVAGGLDSAGNPTTVNGQAGPVVFNSVIHGISAALKGGNDQILFTNLTLPPVSGRNGIFVNSGVGNDVVTLRGKTPNVADITLNSSRPMAYGGVNIAKGFAVYDHTGSDVTRVFDATVNGSFNARYFGGNDTVVFDGSSNTVTRNATIQLVGTHDVVRLNHTTFGQDLLLTTDSFPNASGDTTIKLLDVNVKGATDLRSTGNSFNIVIDGGNTPAQRSSLASLVVVGSGKDSVTIQHSDIGTASLDLGAQDDSVKFVDAVFEQLAVYLGDGNDTLTIGNTRVTRRTTFNGGAGRDQFVNNGGNSLAGATIVSFEK